MFCSSGSGAAPPNPTAVVVYHAIIVEGGHGLCQWQEAAFYAMQTNYTKRFSLIQYFSENINKVFSAEYLNAVLN